MPKRKWKSGCRLTALVLCAVLQACAASLPISTVDHDPLIPPPPSSLMKPPPPEVLSNNAASDIDGWTEKLKSSEAK